MKKLFLLFAVALAMGFIACTNYDIPVIDPEPEPEPEPESKVDPNFYVYLCFGQSNMEGNATPEAQDKDYVDPRFKTLACVNFSSPSRKMGEWYTAYPPIVRQGTGLGMADYFGRTMVSSLPEEVKVGVVDVAIGGTKIEGFMQDKVSSYIASMNPSSEGWLINYFKAYDNVTFEIIDDPTTFISEADVVISCVTVATELLFPDDTLYKKGVTVIPVHVRGFQNCDLFFDKVFGDDTGQIEKFKYFSRFHEYDEIHHVLQGKNPGRTNDDERILSYNYGIALHDIHFASKIFEKSLHSSQGFDYHKQDKKIWV